MEEKKYAITVKNLHIRYRSIQKLSIRKSLFKLKKAKSEYPIRPCKRLLSKIHYLYYYIETSLKNQFLTDHSDTI